MFFDNQPGEHFLGQENRLTETIHSQVTRAQDVGIPPQERNQAWENALTTVAKKNAVTLRISQSLKPRHYNEPLVDKSLIDDRILEGFSPALKELTDSGKVNMYASFAIVEYFLKTGYHRLSQDQATVLAKMFLPQAPQLTFSQYKYLTEQATPSLVIPGKSPEESWTLKREIMDILQIADSIRGRISSYPTNQTIYVSDLVKVAAEALRMVHLADSRYGVKRIALEDKKLYTSNETPQYRDPTAETVSILFRRPDIFLSLLFNKGPRNFQQEIDKVANVHEKIPVEGLENIPPTGPVIVAFSHIDRWIDQDISAGWEKMEMIKAIQKRRANKEISLAAYLTVFQEIAPKFIKGFTKHLINFIAAKIKDRYGIQIIDINPYDTANVKEFLDQSQQILRSEQPLLISPEGLPVTETIKPKRGLGLLARNSGAPVIGVAFREDPLPDGKFGHKVIFTQPYLYDTSQLPGKSNAEKDQAFSETVMRGIANFLPESQRGPFR